jgi:hypothetical protein
MSETDLNLKSQNADISRALKINDKLLGYQELVKESKKPFGTRGFLLKAAPSILLILGLVFSLVSVYSASQSLKNWGSNSYTVGLANSKNYDYTASSYAKIQYWSLRAGYSTVRGITFTLPNNPTEGTLVNVINGTVELRTETGGTFFRLADNLRILNIYSNGILIDTLDSLQSQSYISTKGSGTEQKWYRYAL